MSVSDFPEKNKMANTTIKMEKTDASKDTSTETSCRACANTCIRCYGINSKICNFSATIKDMIVLLVPQMETELDDNDVICNNCRKTLIQCVKFIDKCLRVEADRKENGSCQKSPLYTSPITILEDGVIKKEVDNLSDVDERDTNGRGLNGNFENREETDQAVDINSENINGINDNVFKVLPSSILGHNRLISTQQICTDKLNEFIHILAANDVKTMQLYQDSERITQQKRVILVGSTFKCSKCNKYFDMRNKFTRHLKGHKRLKRREERDRFRKLRSQKLGTQINGPERKQPRKTRVDLECKTCSEKLPSIEDLELHFEIHPPFVCEKCGKGFTKRAQINAHRTVHNEPNSYVCEECGKAFKTRSQLRQHAFIHENTVHACKKCPKVFMTVLRLKSHLRNSHNEGQTSIWTCKECGKTFKRSCLYKTHYNQIHLRDGHRKCDVCGQGFHRSDYLMRHKRRHAVFGETRESLNNEGAKSQANEKIRFRRLPHGTLRGKTRRKKFPPGPFQCQICMKLYKSIFNLKVHIHSHGTARYNCKLCSRTFKLKYLLNRHEKFHEKSDLSEKYRCGICWKRFETPEDLEQHCFSHNNFKHKCELCEESFAREHLLNDHIANVHVENYDAEEEMEILMKTGLGTTLYNLINNVK